MKKAQAENRVIEFTHFVVDTMIGLVIGKGGEQIKAIN
jgi:hypothetical protein